MTRSPARARRSHLSFIATFSFCFISAAANARAQQPAFSSQIGHAEITSSLSWVAPELSRPTVSAAQIGEFGRSLDLIAKVSQPVKHGYLLEDL
jgi:hypothetical protein